MSNISDQASGEVIYRITRNRGCHTLKRGAFNLSKDPYNPTGLNQKRFNSFSHNDVAAVFPSPDGKGIIMKKKRSNKLQKPRQLWTRIHSKTNRSRTVSLGIINKTRGKFYRSDMTPRLLRKWSRINNTRLGLHNAPMPRRPIKKYNWTTKHMAAAAARRAARDAQTTN